MLTRRRYTMTSDCATSCLCCGRWEQRSERTPRTARRRSWCECFVTWTCRNLSTRTSLSSCRLLTTCFQAWFWTSARTRRSRQPSLIRYVKQQVKRVFSTAKIRVNQYWKQGQNGRRKSYFMANFVFVLTVHAEPVTTSASLDKFLEVFLISSCNPVRWCITTKLSATLI